MKTDARGCSTCPAGSERWEEFEAGGRVWVQYDYRTPEGRLFACIARTVEEARQKRDAWLAKPCSCGLP
jgi:predicted transcriptional regulator